MISSLQSASEELEELRDQGVVEALKAETEGEGATWHTLGFLSQFARSVNLPLILKIGGCEARTDLMQSRWLGVSGVTAPMIESPFAATKFLGALVSCTSTYDRPESYLLVESQVGLSNLDAIVGVGAGKVDGINFGRSDLTASLNLAAGLRKFDQDDPAVAGMLAEAAQKVKLAGLRTTVGGRLTESSVGVLDRYCGDLLDRVETKRVVLNWRKIRDQPELLQEVLKIELALAEAQVSIAAVEMADRMKMVGELRNRIEMRKPKLEFP